MKSLLTISFIAIELLATTPALACIQFPRTYHCDSGTLAGTYDITLSLEPSPSVTTYTITNVASGKVETYTFPADGTETQIDGTANHALYRSASCTETSLQVNLREIVSTENGATTTRKVTQIYQLMADGKLLRVDLTRSLSTEGSQTETAQYTDFCLYKH